MSTETTLTSSANPSVSGQEVTLTAAVNGQSPGGTVTFQENGRDISGCLEVPLSEGRATCALTSLTPGEHTITA